MTIAPHKAMIYVSAIAIIASPLRSAHAAPTISCTRGISFGTFTPSCTGTLTAKGTASNGTINSGCHTMLSGSVQPAICNIQTTLSTALLNARITLSAPQVQFQNSLAAGQVTLDNYRIETTSGSQLNTHTFAAGLLNPTHTFRLGGRLRFSHHEPSGSYNSSINITVTSIP